MNNYSSVYRFSIISAYYCWGCTFTSGAQARLDLALGEHLSAMSLKSLRAWILTTGEAAVCLEASRGTRHNSCERKQKQHNRLPLEVIPADPGLFMPHEEGKKAGGRDCGQRAWTRLPWGTCCPGSDVIVLVQPLYKSAPRVAVLQLSTLPYGHKHLWHLLPSGNPRKFVPHLLQQYWSKGIKKIQK